MEEKDLFDFNQDISLIDEVQNIALQNKLNFREMLSGIAFNLFFASDLDIQASSCDLHKVYSLWSGEEYNNRLLQHLQNHLKVNALNKLSEFNAKRLEWCQNTWYENFPYTKSHILELGEENVLFVLKVLAFDILKIAHCEFKFLILLRELMAVNLLQKGNFWELSDRILLSDYVVRFIFDNAQESQVKNFSYWLGGFANSQSKLAFFQYLTTFSKLIEKLQRFEKQNENTASLIATMKSYL